MPVSNLCPLEGPISIRLLRALLRSARRSRGTLTGQFKFNAPHGRMFPSYLTDGNTQN